MYITSSAAAVHVRSEMPLERAAFDPEVRLEHR